MPLHAAQAHAAMHHTRLVWMPAQGFCSCGLAAIGRHLAARQLKEGNAIRKRNAAETKAKGKWLDQHAAEGKKQFWADCTQIVGWIAPNCHTSGLEIPCSATYSCTFN